MTATPAILQHYGADALAERLNAALRQAGHDPASPEAVALAGVDQFHTRGLKATEELFERAAFGSDSHVLDVGCGIGGAARYLASHTGCRVTGLDLTPQYVQLAEELTHRAGLSGRVRFRRGDAQALPFADASFDGGYSQHASMNLPDKPRWLAELRRVLRPGGRLALYEVLAGSGEPLQFPVPWARDPQASFLSDEPDLRAALQAAGLRLEQWEDQTAAATEFFSRLAERLETRGLPPVSLHLLLGGDLQAMAGNMRDNLHAGRLQVVMAVAAAG